LYAVFVKLPTVIKTYDQQSDQSSSATYMFAVQFFHWMSLPQNVITVTTTLLHHTCIYHPHGITVKFSQFPR